MSDQENHQRLYDRTKTPTDADIIEFIDETKAIAAWKQVQEFLETRYDLSKEILYYGERYGWLVRYRQSGRTIVSLFPERNSFSFLIVYGKKEIEKFIAQESSFSSEIVDIFRNTEKLHDGKWLWIRVTDSSFIEDLTKLIAIKRKPK
jgi:hypothetical protein